MCPIQLRQPRSERTDASPVLLRRPGHLRGRSLTVLAAIGIVWALWVAQAMLIPIVFAILASYALEPIVARMTTWHIPRALTAMFLLIGIVAIVGCGAYSLRDQSAAFIQQLPAVTQKLTQAIRERRGGTGGTVETMQKAASELEKAATEATPAAAPPPRGVTRVRVEEPPLKMADFLWRGSMGAVELTAQLVAIFFLVFYLLASGDIYKRKVAKILGPSLARKKVAIQILDEINAQVERFLLVRLVISLLVGVASWIAFRVLGLQQAAIWGIAAGVLNTIPYFGPATVAIAVALMAFAQFGTIAMAVAIGGAAVAIATIEGYLITPWLTSRAASMNAVAVFVSLLFWGWIWGVWGLLLAVPITMVVKSVCDRIEDLKPIGELIGE